VGGNSQHFSTTADVVVIGAGFGGLGAALTLAEGGARVVLLEALTYPGGCASTFERGGYAFEAGATLFSGFGPGQLMRRWIDERGLDVSVDWLDPVIELRWPGHRLPVHRDRDAFVASLCARPGAPERALRRFFARQARVADTLWALFEDPSLLPPFDGAALFTHLRRSPRYLPLLPLMGRSMGALLRRDGLGDFEPLRIYLDALCQITVQVRAEEAEAPFALAATDYAFRGTAHVRGGIGELARALMGAVSSAGGACHLATRVRKLQRSKGGWEVHTRRGVVRAPLVVANLLPQTIVELTGEEGDARLAGLASRVEQGWGAAMWYLGVRADALPTEAAHHLELIADPASPFVEGNHVFCSVSASDERHRAPEGQRTVTMSTHVPMTKLRGLADDEAGPYVAGVQQRMRRTLETLAPEIAGAVVTAMSASPRTFERFTGRPHGYVGGIPRRTGLSSYRGMVPSPLLEGLYMVGDTAFPGQSTLATAIGGAKTAARILEDLRRHHRIDVAPARTLAM